MSTATTEAPTMETTTALEPLRVIDRCDNARCNARAYVRVEIKDMPLDFCGHHYAAHEPALIPAGAVVLEDIRDQLTARETGDHA